MAFSLKDIFTSNITAFGLDFSDRAVKIAELVNQKGRLGLLGIGRLGLNEGILVNGEIKKPMELVRAIKEVRNKTKPFPIKNKNVVCALPELKCFMRVAELPKMPQEEINEAIKWKAEEYFPLTHEEMYLDWQIVENLGHLLMQTQNYQNHNNEKHNPFSLFSSAISSNITVLLAAAPKNLVDSYLNVLAMAGLEPYVFEVESVATVRGLVIEGERSGAILIVDLGADRTSFIIYQKPTILFTSSISMNSENFTELISKDLKVSQSQAEEVKTRYGLNRPYKGNLLAKSLESTLNLLVEEINKHLDYYRDHFSRVKSQNLSFASSSGIKGAGKVFGQDEISRIVLCGGEANLLGLVSYLSLKLHRQIELGNPWVNIIKSHNKLLPPIPFDKSLAYTTTLGLALRGLQL